MKTIILVILLTVVGASAQAQRNAPNLLDLRASYCIALLQNSISALAFIREDNFVPPDLKQSTLNDLVRAENNLLRLQSYLLPRVNFLDATGLITAKDQFITDRTQVNLCSDKCEGSTDEKVKCYSNCGKTLGMQDRYKTCNDLSWMPY
jgi:hypothetical protein